MSLAEVSLSSIIFKQYIYKLKGNSGLVYTLIIAQLFGLLLSMGPKSGMSSGDEVLHVSVKTFSGDTTVFLSFAWIIVIAAILTTKQYQNMEFSLVTNRVSSSLSNIMFLLTCSSFAGITSTLMSVLYRVIMVFTSDQASVIFNGTITTNDLLLGILVSSLYMILLAAVAYLVRLIIEVNKMFAIIVPVVFIGLLTTNTQFFGDVIKFYVLENSLALFTLKVLITAIILFGMSVLLSNRMEVNR